MNPVGQDSDNEKKRKDALGNIIKQNKNCHVLPSPKSRGHIGSAVGRQELPCTLQCKTEVEEALEKLPVNATLSPFHRYQSRCVPKTPQPA